MQPTTVPARSPDPPPAATLPHVPFRLDDHSDMPDASLSPLLERIAAALERMVPPPAGSRRFRRQPTPSSGRPAASGCARCRGWPGVPYDLLCGIERVAETLLREHAPVRRRPARQQRAALGCARHGQELAGQGDPCPAERAAAGQPGADRDPSRGHREPAPAAPSARGRAAGAASCSATTCRSMPARPATSR